MLCSDALKYLVHFFGDITQPLHCSEKSLGGNQIFIKFDGLRRNLHEVPSPVTLSMLPLFPFFKPQREMDITEQLDMGHRNPRQISHEN